MRPENRMKEAPRVWGDTSGRADESIATGIRLHLYDSTSEDAAQDLFAPVEPFELERRMLLPEFPTSALPAATRAFVAAVEDSLCVAPSMVCPSVLAAVATAVQRRYCVHIEGDWKEQLSFFAVTVAAPSERKSGVFREVTQPLETYERDERLARAPEIQEWKTNIQILEGQVEAAKKAVIANKSGKADDQRDELRDLEDRLAKVREAEVRPCRLICDDSTSEGLADLLARNGGVMSLFAPEASTMFSTAAGRYSDGRTNLGVYLSGYSGDTLRIFRKSGTDIRIDDPRLTICAMIQPKAFEKVMKNVDFDGTGLLSRFLYCFPKSFVGHRPFLGEAIDPAVRDGYHAAIRFLLEASSEGAPVDLELSPDALEVAESFHKEVEPSLSLGGDLEAIGTWAGKLTGQVARIAGLLHALSAAERQERPEDSEISGETYQNAVRAGKFFLEHAKAAFDVGDLLDTPETRDAKALWKRLGGVTEISKRDLYERVKGRFAKASGMDPGLDELTRRGYVRREVRSSGRGRPSEIIVCNPDAPRAGGRV